MPVVELAIDSRESIKGLNAYDKAIDSSAKKTDTAFAKMRKSVNSVGGDAKLKIAAGFAAATAAVVGFGVALSSAGVAAREMENLSRLAGTSTEDFQNLTIATQKYGVSAEHLADISKDVSDKLGDFIATGAGPFKDFFENVAPQVGLTAEALAKLSGPDALIAVKNAMDQANVSAAEQVFYLESIGNDLTLLNPLLADNGALWREAATQAAAMGLALTQIQTDKLTEGMEAVAEIQKTLLALKDKVLAELAPAVTAFADALKSAFLETGQSVDDVAQIIAGALLDGLQAVIKVVHFMHNAFNGVKLVITGLVVVVAAFAQAALTALSAVGEGLEWLGLIDDNPLGPLLDDVKELGETARQSFSDQLDSIVETDQAYDKLEATVQGVVETTKAGFGESTAAVQEQTVAVEAVAADWFEAGTQADWAAQTATTGMETVNDATNKAADTTKAKLIPAEVELKNKVQEVTQAATASSVAFGTQAAAADKVAASIDRIADSATRLNSVQNTESQKKSMGSAPAMSQAESQFMLSQSPVNRDANYAGGSQGRTASFSTSGDRKRAATDMALKLNTNQNSLQSILGSRDSGMASSNITNIFSQKFSRSDVVSITQEQLRTGQRT